MESKDTDELVESCRRSLYRTITDKVKDSKNEVSVFVLDPSLEEFLYKNMVERNGEIFVNVDPKNLQAILSGLHDLVEEATNLGEKMVVLCAGDLRRHFKKIIEKYIPNMLVIGHEEIAPEIKINTIGTVRI